MPTVTMRAFHNNTDYGNDSDSEKM